MPPTLLLVLDELEREGQWPGQRVEERVVEPVLDMSEPEPGLVGSDTLWVQRYPTPAGRK